MSRFLQYPQYSCAQIVISYKEAALGAIEAQWPCPECVRVMTATRRDGALAVAVLQKTRDYHAFGERALAVPVP
jgi:hypothetical protein